MSTKKLTKSLVIKQYLHGRGVVNFDGASAKMHAPVNFKNDNMKLSKTSIEIAEESDDKTSKKIRKTKISSNALRNAIFAKEQQFQTSHVLASVKSYVPYLISNKSSLVRGYLFAVGEGQNIKRKSPLMVTDAIQSNNSVLKMEVGSTSGARSDTSFFEYENIGDVTYESTSVLDLMEMQFLSCDPIFDRPAFNEDYWDTFHTLLQENLECNIQDKTGFYAKKTSEMPIAEKGILLSEEVCKSLTTYTLLRMFQAEILRANAFAKTYKIEVFLADENQIGIDPNKKPDLTLIHGENSVEDIEKFVKRLKFANGYREARQFEIDGGEEYRKSLSKNKKAKEEKKAKKSAAKTKRSQKTPAQEGL